MPSRAQSAFSNSGYITIGAIRFASVSSAVAGARSLPSTAVGAAPSSTGSHGSSRSSRSARPTVASASAPQTIATSSSPRAIRSERWLTSTCGLSPPRFERIVSRGSMPRRAATSAAGSFQRRDAMSTTASAPARPSSAPPEPASRAAAATTSAHISIGLGRVAAAPGGLGDADDDGVSAGVRAHAAADPSQ